MPAGGPPAAAPTWALALTHATAPNAGAPAEAPRHGPKPTMLQPQGPTLAQTLAGTRRRAATTGPADTTDTANTEDHTLPETHGPETGQQPGTTDSTDTPPAPPADPRRAAPRRTPEPGPQVARTMKVAGDQAARCTPSEWPSQMQKQRLSRQLTLLPGCHLRPPRDQQTTPMRRPAHQATHHPWAEQRAYCATAHADQPSTDDE